MNVHCVYNGEQSGGDSDPVFLFSWGRIKDFKIQGNKLCVLQFMTDAMGQGMRVDRGQDGCPGNVGSGENYFRQNDGTNNFFRKTKLDITYGVQAVVQSVFWSEGRILGFEGLKGLGVVKYYFK